MTSLEFRCAFSSDSGQRPRVTRLFDDLMDHLCSNPAVLDAAIEVDHSSGQATISLTLNESGSSTAARALVEQALSDSSRGDLPIRLTA